MRPWIEITRSIASKVCYVMKLLDKSFSVLSCLAYVHKILFNVKCLSMGIPVYLILENHSKKLTLTFKLTKTSTVIQWVEKITLNWHNQQNSHIVQSKKDSKRQIGVNADYGEIIAKFSLFVEKTSISTILDFGYQCLPVFPCQRHTRWQPHCVHVPSFFHVFFKYCDISLGIKGFQTSSKCYKVC